MNDSTISLLFEIMFNKKTISVIGENISIPYFESDEFIIKGTISKIEISK